jgi:hypothetical protein
MQYFADEIIKNIFDYIPYNTLTWLSKTNYDKFHTAEIERHIKKTGKKMDTYLRHIIRLDNHIALQDMLNNSPFFHGIKSNDNCKNKYNNTSINTYNHKIKYKNKKYANIIDFLLYLSIENDKPSTKCKNTLIEYVKK